MSKTYRNIGIGLATLTGVLTAYATFRPEFEEQRLERLGHSLPPKDRGSGTVLSDQMRADFKEAGQELRETEKGGFAWGIRKALFGGRKDGGGNVKEGGERGEGKG